MEPSISSMRLAGNASVPAGGPFIVLLPAGGRFKLLAAGPSDFRASWWALRIVLNVTAGVPLQVWAQLLSATVLLYQQLIF